MYSLMDFDPDGVAIMSTYKYGSISLCHENASLRVPDLGWLGIKSADIFSHLFSMFQEPMIREPNEQMDPDRNTDVQGFLQLTQRDRRKACRMLQREEVRKESEWVRELQLMLMLNTKVEIQFLSSRPGGLERWLEQRLVDVLRI